MLKDHTSELYSKIRLYTRNQRLNEPPYILDDNKYENNDN